MQATESGAPSEGGRLLANLLQFARLLRRLGLPISASQVADLAGALPLVDLRSREDFYHVTAGMLLHSAEHRQLFDRAFDRFWSGGQEWLLTFGPTRAGQAYHQQNEETDGARDIYQPAIPDDRADEPVERLSEPVPEVASTYSSIELLHTKDFARFSQEELESARRFIESLIWRLSSHPTRRAERSPKRDAMLDFPRTIRQSMARGGEIVDFRWRRRKHKPRPLTVICDISGSMDRYSRLFLHFIHTLLRGPQRVEAFVFGTRLTRITPALRHRDLDHALDEVSGLVQDWAGGTRIGESLRTFNFTWSRRALGRGAVAIIISDGWDRGDINLLIKEIARLRRSVHRLIWLNPLIGTPGYEPLVQGIRAVLPHVDDFLPLHNLASLEQLALLLTSQVSHRV